MNLRIILFTHLFLASYIQGDPIKLESTILAQVDGLSIGINGEIIGLLKQYRSQIIALLLGTKTPNGRIGSYEFQGNKCSIQELRQFELEYGSTHPQLLALRQQMRVDFERISEPFRKRVQGEGPTKDLSRMVMGMLIKEWGTKRNRLDSLIYVWAQKSDQNEYELFDIHVKSIKDFEIFLTDLNNFLGDLIYSCPRACAQFQDHVDKFNRAQQFAIELNLTKEQKYNFCKYINTVLPTLAKNDITKNKIEELYTTFTLTLSKA